MIQIKDLNKVYENGSHAVKDFNLDIHDNEFVVFVGPSGWEVYDLTYDSRSRRY